MVYGEYGTGRSETPGRNTEPCNRREGRCMILVQEFDTESLLQRRLQGEYFRKSIDSDDLAEVGVRI